MSDLSSKKKTQNQEVGLQADMAALPPEERAYLEQQLETDKAIKKAVMRESEAWREFFKALKILVIGIVSLVLCGLGLTYSDINEVSSMLGHFIVFLLSLMMLGAGVCAFAGFLSSVAQMLNVIRRILLRRRVMSGK